VHRLTGFSFKKPRDDASHLLGGSVLKLALECGGGCLLSIATPGVDSMTDAPSDYSSQRTVNQLHGRCMCLEVEPSFGLVDLSVGR